MEDLFIIIFFIVIIVSAFWRIAKESSKGSKKETEINSNKQSNKEKTYERSQNVEKLCINLSNVESYNRKDFINLCNLIRDKRLNSESYKYVENLLDKIKLDIQEKMSVLNFKSDIKAEFKKIDFSSEIQTQGIFKGTLKYLEKTSYSMLETIQTNIEIDTIKKYQKNLLESYEAFNKDFRSIENYVKSIKDFETLAKANEYLLDICKDNKTNVEILIEKREIDDIRLKSKLITKILDSAWFEKQKLIFAVINNLVRATNIPIKSSYTEELANDIKELIGEKSVFREPKEERKYSYKKEKNKTSYKETFNTNLYVDYKPTPSNVDTKKYINITSYGTYIPYWLYDDVYSIANSMVEDKGSVKDLDLLGLYYFYHMTHIENLESIIYHGLRNHNNAYKRVRIDNVDLNERGAYKKVYGRNIHEYVRMYINFRNAMLYKNKDENVVLLGIGNRIVNLYPKERIVFSDRNAYSNMARFSNDYLVLKDSGFIDLNNVFSYSWKNDYNVKQIMMSEVMVYDKIYTKNIDFIIAKEGYCSNKALDIVQGNIPVLIVDEYSRVFFGN